MARSSDVSGQICRRCGEAAVIQGRNEPLCKSDFINYVQTKVVKRMEQFRVRNAEPGKQRTLLLPLSLGISSLSLLYILDGHLQSQIARTGRTGFDIHVLHACMPDGDWEQEQALFETVKRRFPLHMYTSIRLFNYGDTNPQDAQLHSTDTTYDPEKWDDLISAIPTNTARTDVVSILRTRRIVEQAQFFRCEGILWGHTTTALAERILAETAKGRGFSMPSQIADGPSPWENVSFYYPMRDLLRKELLVFKDFVEPGLTSLVLEEKVGDVVPAASKNGSIDALMGQYFETVEEQYPSIVANVVRTAGKLEQRKSLNAVQCILCKMGFDTDAEAQKGLCYGSTSALPRECWSLIPH